MQWCIVQKSDELITQLLLPTDKRVMCLYIVLYKLIGPFTYHTCTCTLILTEQLSSKAIVVIVHCHILHVIHKNPITLPNPHSILILTKPAFIFYIGIILITTHKNIDLQAGLRHTPLPNQGMYSGLQAKHVCVNLMYH